MKLKLSMYSQQATSCDLKLAGSLDRPKNIIVILIVFKFFRRSKIVK